jgi:hypothetical protein
VPLFSFVLILQCADGRQNSAPLVKIMGVQRNV